MKITTTIRLDDGIKKRALAIAKKYGLTFTDIVSLALGEMFRRGARIPPVEYSEEFMEELWRDADEAQRLYKEGKIKGYDNPKEAIAAMHREAEEYLDDDSDA